MIVNRTEDNAWRIVNTKQTSENQTGTEQNPEGYRMNQKEGKGRTVLKMAPSSWRKASENISAHSRTPALAPTSHVPFKFSKDHCNSHLSAWRPQILLNQAPRVGPLWPGTAFEHRLFSHQNKSSFHFSWRVPSNVKGVQMKKSSTWNGLSRLHSHLPVALKIQPSLNFHPSWASIPSLLPFLPPLFPSFSTLCPLTALSSW